LQELRIDPVWEKYNIFDAHTHIGDYYDIDAAMSADGLITYMKEYNIRYSAVSAVTKDMYGDNNRVAEAFKKYPDQLLGLAHIDPSAGESALAEVERCLRLGFRGLKLHPHYDAYMVFDSKLVFPVLEKAAHHRLPILVHTGTPPMTTPIHVGYLAQHFPEIKFICGHMGFGDSSYEAPEAGEMAENVYMDLTAASVHSMIERAIKRLGAERFVWGTDQPYLTFIGEFFKLLSLRIPDEDKRKILWENPKRIYGMA
jgi:hypothetical protein